MEIWYKLNDYNVDAVDIPEGSKVRNLKHAIKKEWGDRLPWAVAELKVFTAGGNNELQAYDPVPTDSTGPNPLVVVTPLPEQKHQQQEPRVPSIVQLLEEAKGGPLTDSEVDYALIYFPKQIDSILSASTAEERKRIVNSLWMRLSVRIKTQTKLAVRAQYLFDGPVPGAFGGFGTEVQFAVKGSALYCAKTMRNTGNLQQEYDVATRIHENQICPTVMPVLGLVQLPGDRISMVTPYYPLPLSPLANGNLHEEGCINVALCGIATIKAFQTKGLCHGDIKPANMMLTAGGDNLVVMIDFGSTVEYGKGLASWTPKLGLDCLREGSLTYDLTCLASSLYMICTGEKLPDTSGALLENIEAKISMRRPALQIAKCCLEASDIDLIWKQAQTFVAAADDVNRSLIVPFNSIWPKSIES